MDASSKSAGNSNGLGSMMTTEIVDHMGIAYMVFYFLTPKGGHMQFTNMQDELRFTRKRRNIERHFEDYFEDKGYAFIDPEIFQTYEGFLEAEMMLDARRTVKVLSGDAQIMILRPDITMSVLERTMKLRKDDDPLKIYYNSKIYLNTGGSKISELRQMGAEYLGEDSIKADQEIIAMAVEVLANLKTPFILELGTSKYLGGLFESLPISKIEKQTIRGAISRKNQGELVRIISEMKLDQKVKDLLSQILSMQGDIDAVISLAEQYEMNEEMGSAMEELKALRDFFEIEKIRQWIHFDLSMVPDLDYYDGMIFKGYSFSSPKKILSGGRYDSLTEKFGKRTSAIGFSVNMDEMARLLMQEDK
jgi:ATP phosphoribosyltransferase regulatory subunit